MQMMEQKQSYAFVQCVFGRYHHLQMGVSDRMAQSSMDIGPEASILIERYFTVIEWKPASINQPTKIYNEHNRMGAVWALYSCSMSNHGQKRGMTVLELQPQPYTIYVPEVQEHSTMKYIQQLGMLAVANTPGVELTSGLRERQ